eukprot:15743840-Heterocapsa_arctica.AAC.1
MEKTDYDLMHKDYSEYHTYKQKLKKDIQEYTATAEQFDKEIAERDKDIPDKTGDTKADTKVCEMEK